MDLNDLHSQLLDILLEFDRICRCNDIKYSIAFGTLLGAVRHKGFIPWDDDVDVMLDRENYEKFRIACENSSSPTYFFQSKQTEKNYYYNVSRLRKNNTAMIYEEWKKAGFHLGIYIDICPVDKIADSWIARRIQYFFIIINTVVRLSQNKELFMNSGGRFSGFVKGVLYAFTRLMPKGLCDRIETYFITKYNNSPCKMAGIICDGGVLLNTPRDMLPFESRLMSAYKDIEFEKHNLMCVKDTDAILKHWYGDYMKLPPENERVLTHSPLVYDTENSYEKYQG